MEGLVCKYCGGNQFNKTVKGYECTYCHTLYEFEPEKKERLSNKNRRWSIAVFAILILGLGSNILIPYFSQLLLKDGNLFTVTKTNDSDEVTYSEKTSSSSKATYSANQLNNPERNVRIAELSLNQADIEQAVASVKKYGGEKTKKFEERLDKAKKEQIYLKKNRAKAAPKTDMLIENPDSEFAVTTYYREAGYLAAYGPEFNQYSPSDILGIWGQPDAVITDSDQIEKNLTLEFDEKNNPISYEAKMINAQWQQGQLTWREVRAFSLILKDSSFAAYTKEFVYEKQGKPNVYFTDGHVGYVTPIIRYLSFTRLPEKYPREGLGKYPDDFPKNYGLDGRFHDK